MLKQKYNLSLFIILSFFYAVSAQEQVSFNHRWMTTDYPVLEMFEHEEEARLLSVDENSEILITTMPHDGTEKDTLLLLMETELELPYANEFHGDNLAQIFRDKVVFVNIKTLEVNIKVLNVPTVYSNIAIEFNSHYLFLSENLDQPFYKSIRIDDLTEYEIPRDFVLSLDNEWFYNENYAHSTVDNLILYNLVSQSYDTIVESGGGIRVELANDRLYVKTDTEVFWYDWINEVKTLLYTFGPADNKSFDLFKEEVIIYEYLGTTLTMIVMDLDGQNIQSSELTGLSEGSNYFNVLLKSGSDFFFKRNSSSYYRTNNLNTIEEVYFPYESRFYPEASDSLFYYTNGDVLRSYDLETNMDSEVDIIIDGDQFHLYLDFLKMGDHCYLESNGVFFVDYQPTEGIERILYRNQYPQGFTYRFEFMTTDSVLYAVNRYDSLYCLQGAGFQTVPNIILGGSDPVEFRDAIYFRGMVDGFSDDFYRVQGDAAPVLVDETTNYYEKSEDGNFLLLLDRSFGERTYSVISDNQNDAVILDIVPDGNFEFDNLSIGSTIYLKRDLADSISISALNLSTNTFEHLFDCNWYGQGFALHNKFVLPIRNTDNIAQLAFIDRWSNQVEFFTPPTSGGGEHDLIVYRLNCDPESLLFEVSKNDSNSFEIWSTEGTLASTELLLEREVIGDKEFGDFSLHRHLGDLFFSVKVGDNLYEHYSYNCDSKSLELDTYPDDVVLCRRFNSGNSIFGISLKDPINGHSLLNITAPDNSSYVSPLGYYRYAQEITDYGITISTSQPMAHGENNRHLAILSILGFGQELCYVYDDGTIEILVDLNPGIANAFLDVNNYSTFNYKGVKEVFHDGYLYFDAYSRKGGHQIYRLSNDNLFTSNNNVTNDPTLINLYPNPSPDQINVKLKESKKYQWSIINIDGKIIKKGLGNSEIESYDISELETGFYYFYMEIEGKRLARGFVKE